MKRIISVFMVAVFLFGFALPAAAAEPQPPISRDEAVKLARAAVEIPDGLKLNSVSYRYDEFGSQVWAFSWNSGDPKAPRDVSVEIDAVNGKLRAMYQYSPDNFGESKLNADEALVIAREFLQKMNPEEYSQLKLDSQNLPKYGIPEKDMRLPEYYFRFNRVVNGYPYWDNGANVSVSAHNGKVISYNFNWDAGELPSVEDMVYQSEAKKIFLDKVGVDLNYLRVYKDGGPAEIALGYATPVPYMQIYVDAVSGQLIDYSGNPVDFKAKASNIPIGEGAAPAPADTSLTMEEAMELAKQWVDLKDTYKLNSVNYWENQDGVSPAVWNFSWVERAGTVYSYINVGVNARTGEVVNMDINSDPLAQLTGIDEEEAKNIAIEFLKKVVPSKVDELRADPNYNGDYYPVEKMGMRPAYYFHFSRLVNGVPFADNGVNVTVNGQGKVISYYSNWEEFKFPSTAGTINADTAADLLTGQMGFDLGFVRTRDTEQDWKIRLVYRINSAEFFVDAKTGEIRSRWEGRLLYSTVPYGDISGHWAEKDIQKLAELNILDTGSKEFNPDASAGRGEVVAMLAKALQLNSFLPEQPTFADVPVDHRYFGYIEAAKKAGIIAGHDGKFNPDTAISRQEFAVILVRGLGSTGTSGDSKLEQFKDARTIADWAADSVLEAVNLGLIKGDANGNFNPVKDVTKAEAAALIARVLELNRG